MFTWGMRFFIFLFLFIFFIIIICMTFQPIFLLQALHHHIITTIMPFTKILHNDVFCLICPKSSRLKDSIKHLLLSLKSASVLTACLVDQIEPSLPLNIFLSWWTHACIPVPLRWDCSNHPTTVQHLYFPASLKLLKPSLSKN